MDSEEYKSGQRERKSKMDNEGVKSGQRERKSKMDNEGVKNGQRRGQKWTTKRTKMDNEEDKNGQRRLYPELNLRKTIDGRGCGHFFRLPHLSSFCSLVD